MRTGRNIETLSRFRDVNRFELTPTRKIRTCLKNDTPPRPRIDFDATHTMGHFSTGNLRRGREPHRIMRLSVVRPRSYLTVLVDRLEPIYVPPGCIYQGVDVPHFS